MARSKFRIEWDSKLNEYRSVFPEPFTEWNRTHETITMAYDYMRKDAKVTSYIQVIGRDAAA